MWMVDKSSNSFGSLCKRFTEEQVEQIDRNKQWSRALDGSDYLPGMVCLLFLVHICLILTLNS